MVGLGQFCGRDSRRMLLCVLAPQRSEHLVLVWYIHVSSVLIFIDPEYSSRMIGFTTPSAQMRTMSPSSVE